MDCKDYHPIEVCKLPNCDVAKCLKRHPQSCRYFRSGSCRFKESCKYAHKEYINSNELLEKIKNLENYVKQKSCICNCETKDKTYENELLNKIKNLEYENQKIVKMSENQAESINLLKSNLSHLQKEYVSVLNHAINKVQDDDKETKMDEDTSACDDQFDTNVNQEMNKENTVIQNESSPMVCDTVENVQWTPDKDVELCKEMIKNLRGIKIKAKANKKEESTSILKRMTDMFTTKF